MPEGNNVRPAAGPAKVRVAIACQGGGAHTAFTAGVLDKLLEVAASPTMERRDRDSGGQPVRFDIVGLSGTSGGAICAALAWKALLLNSVEARAQLKEFWTAVYPHGNAALDLADPRDWMDAALAAWRDGWQGVSLPWLRWLDDVRVTMGLWAL